MRDASSTPRKTPASRQIDHLITTHWHGDHYGGLAELASRIPIRHFIDHGPTVQKNEATEKYLQTMYPELYAKAKHTVVKPGDTIPIAGYRRAHRDVERCGHSHAAP